MAISFYDASVGTYTRVLDSVAAILDKGAAFASDTALDPQNIVETGLREDMMPFHFSEKSMVFAVGERELPFTNENFLLSFSIPNFYFHATIAYDILRMLGMPLSKIDFLGRIR